ncbi:MAG TPA: hypothetical protein IAA01_05920 [Candidatus Fournierella excrementavium]|nr:hypothetical protein [Candidatus Fournierella excrementavium]
MKKTGERWAIPSISKPPEEWDIKLKNNKKFFSKSPQRARPGAERLKKAG